MMFNMRFVWILAATSVVSYAQGLPALRPSQLDSYLAITPDQSRAMSENVRSFSTWSTEKLIRLFEVRAEIETETAKTQLDALGLGMRYVEVEAICRQGRDKTEELRRANLNVLNATQKAKLAALEDAVKLMPLITEAQSRNLISGPTVQISPSLDLQPGRATTIFPTIVLGSTAGFPVTGCPGWATPTFGALSPFFPLFPTNAQQ